MIFCDLGTWRAATPALAAALALSCLVSVPMAARAGAVGPGAGIHVRPDGGVQQPDKGVTGPRPPKRTMYATL